MTSSFSRKTRVALGARKWATSLAAIAMLFVAAPAVQAQLPAADRLPRMTLKLWDTDPTTPLRTIRAQNNRSVAVFSFGLPHQPVEGIVS